MPQSESALPAVPFQHARSLLTLLPGPETPAPPLLAIVMTPPAAIMLIPLPAVRVVSRGLAEPPVALAQMWPLRIGGAGTESTPAEMAIVVLSGRAQPICEDVAAVQLMTPP